MPGGFVVFLGLVLLFALQIVFGLALGVLHSLAVAVVGLVVHDDDVLQAHQIAA